MDDELDEMPILEKEEYLETTNSAVNNLNQESSENVHNQQQKISASSTIADQLYNYVDKKGKAWKFIKKIDPLEDYKKELRKFRRHNFLIKNESKNGEFLIEMSCKMKGKSLNKLKEPCKMVALYRLTDGRLFISGNHNHPLEEDDDEVKEEPKAHHRKGFINEGRLILITEREKQILANIFRNINQQYGHMVLNCFAMPKGLIYSQLPAKWDFISKIEERIGALFVEKKEAIYAVSFVEHNHPIEENTEINLEKNDEEETQEIVKFRKEYDSYYLDSYGKRWSLQAGIESNEDVKKWCQKNWMRSNSSMRTQKRNKIFYACKLSAYFRHTGKKERPPPYCQFRAQFNRISSRMYAIGEHNHDLDSDKVDGTNGQNTNKRKNDEVEDEDEELEECSWDEELSNEEEEDEDWDESEQSESDEQESNDSEQEELEKMGNEQSKDKEDDDEKEEEESKQEEDEEESIEEDEEESIEEDEEESIEEDEEESIEEDEEEIDREDEESNDREEGEKEEEFMIQLERAGEENTDVLTKRSEGELCIVEEINRDRDYKWLPHFKKEGETRPSEWPTMAIEGNHEDEMPTTHPQFRTAKRLMPVKKEEPLEEEEQQQPQIPIIKLAAPILPERGQNQQIEAKKMLLRERKRKINYAE